MCDFKSNSLSDGYTCFYSSDSKLFNFLDKSFLNFIIEYDYDEYRIPAMINGDILRKCGYFSSFPQQLTVASFVDEKYYEKIHQENDIKTEYLIKSDKYLTPSACLHFYPMLEGTTIYEKIITTCARVYRYESEKMNNSTRLWDFTVREIVFIGSKQYVEEKLNILMQKALDFAKTITSNAVIKDANDHFYPSRRNEVKKKMQQTNSLKKELIIPISNENVSVASFNFHNYHFSKTFNFDNNGTIVSGCVGFGIERWLAACKYYKFKI